MKEIEANRERLVLERRPAALAAGLVAAALACTVAAVVLLRAGQDWAALLLVAAVSVPVYLYFFFETHRLSLDRATGEVAFTIKTPRGLRETRRPLAGLARAEAQRPGATPEARRLPAEAPDSTPARAVLVWRDGAEMPLAEGFGRAGPARALAGRLARWLAET